MWQWLFAKRCNNSASKDIKQFRLLMKFDKETIVWQLFVFFGFVNFFVDFVFWFWFFCPNFMSHPDSARLRRKVGDKFCFLLKKKQKTLRKHQPKKLRPYPWWKEEQRQNNKCLVRTTKGGSQKEFFWLMQEFLLSRWRPQKQKRKKKSANKKNHKTT